MLTALFRTVILYSTLLVSLRLTGKRQLGQLEPTELALSLLLSDLAAVPMQDPGIPLVIGLVPMVTLVALSLLLSGLSLKSIFFRRLLCGRPVILIRDGIIQQEAMRRSRIMLDELLEELRLQGIIRIEDVKYALWETGGQLSVLLRTACQPVTPQQLELPVEEETQLPAVLISDGRLLTDALYRLGLDETWLAEELRKRHLNAPRQVFLMTRDGSGQVRCVRKEGTR